MGWIEAVVLGIVQGLTEFLPISSSAHVRVVGELMNPGEDPGAAFTAIIVVFAFIFSDWPRETVALTAAGFLLLSRRISSKSLLHEVDGELILLIMGLFVVNAGLSATGLPQQLVTYLAAEGINSPNVVGTYDYREVETDGGFTVCFIIMEYIRGESLADLIAREGQLTEDVALDVLEQAAHGLAVIHRMGLVHRDIKPGNLMITQNGKVKITDFGIAKAAAAVPLTRTGMVVGTAQYVSPEQAQGMKVTAASDVYSLGSTLYAALEGTRDKTGTDPVVTLKRALDNVKPTLEVKSRRVGGATYQVPVEVKPNRANTLALRWLVTFSRQRREKTMVERLANELLDASNGLGASVKRREDTHKMAEANRAFAHYRW